MTVDVIMLAFGSVEKTRRALAALARSEHTDFHLILIDNSVEKNHAPLLAGFDHPTTLIVPHGNLGFATANNLGARKGTGVAILLLNNDCYLEPAALGAMVRCLEAQEKVAIVGAQLHYPDGLVQHVGMAFSSGFEPYHIYRGVRPEQLPRVVAGPAPSVTGACFLVRRAVWTAMDGLDELFDPMYYEDVDLCIRARSAGYQVWYCPEARAIHEDGGSNGRAGAHDRGTSGGRSRKEFISRWHTIYRDLNDLSPR